MAVDSALLDLADGEGAAFLRLYRWEPFCLSFGRHEPTARRYDLERIHTLGLDCVRRPTGGRAVWHARELTYAVAAPLACFGGMRDAYHRIHAMLAAALQALGASPELAPLSPKPQSLSPSSGPCFSTPVGGEVLLDNRKVIGSAQLRQGDAVLQHGSLLLEDDQSLPRSLAGLASPESGDAEAPLSRSLGRRVSFEEAVAAVTGAAQVHFGPLLPQSRLPSALTTRVRLHAERFQDPAWTWQR
jgi:lipoate-protein ligase A